MQMMRLLGGWLFIVLGLAVAMPALAQETPVGRISVVAGHVIFRPAGNTAGWAGEINDPVAAGSVIETGPDGRALIRIGPDAVALSSNTVLYVARLGEGDIDLALKQGRVGLRLRPLGAGAAVEVDAT